MISTKSNTVRHLISDWKAKSITRQSSIQMQKKKKSKAPTYYLLSKEMNGHILGMTMSEQSPFSIGTVLDELWNRGFIKQSIRPEELEKWCGGIRFYIGFDQQRLFARRSPSPITCMAWLRKWVGIIRSSFWVVVRRWLGTPVARTKRVKC